MQYGWLNKMNILLTRRGWEMLSSICQAVNRLRSFITALFDSVVLEMAVYIRNQGADVRILENNLSQMWVASFGLSEMSNRHGDAWVLVHEHGPEHSWVCLVLRMGKVCRLGPRPALGTGSAGFSPTGPLVCTLHVGRNRSSKALLWNTSEVRIHRRPLRFLLSQIHGWHLKTINILMVLTHHIFGFLCHFLQLLNTKPQIPGMVLCCPLHFLNLTKYSNRTCGSQQSFVRTSNQNVFSISKRF